MEIILTKDYTPLGYEGDICKVKDGYARNYLIPKQIAIVKNRASLKTLEQMQKNLEKKRAKRVMEAEALKGKIIELKLVIPVKVADNGKLYGSVSQQVIVDQLKEQEIEINKRDVHMEHHIKELGHYEIEIKLYHSVTAIIKLDVIDIEAKDKVAEVEVIEEPKIENTTSEIIEESAEEEVKTEEV